MHSTPQRLLGLVEAKIIGLYLLNRASVFLTKSLPCLSVLEGYVDSGSGNILEVERVRCIDGDIEVLSESV